MPLSILRYDQVIYTIWRSDQSRLVDVYTPEMPTGQFSQTWSADPTRRMADPTGPPARIYNRLALSKLFNVFMVKSPLLNKEQLIFL